MAEMLLWSLAKLARGSCRYLPYGSLIQSSALEIACSAWAAICETSGVSIVQPTMDRIYETVSNCEYYG